ncbi:hypothetical protein RchiOBHm_Chr3g0481651 [Rosa chinensis]|uniref:Uncharacterized protein n=1 Tax=Rosa chinensis TaxID=74649 RepID=A0A2P6RDZ4_ROSCH|nr:hypothetical protein RchiOBHm_Chr3g0481651 [Rosa chinensis]
MGLLNPFLASAEKPRLDSQKHKIGRSSTKHGADSKQKSVHTVTKTEASVCTVGVLIAIILIV